MQDRGESRDPTATSSSHELVFALCHEVGNLLAAARLEASLLAADAGSAAVERASERLSEISARAGSLMGLVRPLLLPAVETLATDPSEILQGLRRGLDASFDSLVAIDLESAEDLPDVELAADVLHHLLLTVIFFGVDAGGQAGGVCVTASARGDRVVFLVDDGGIADAQGEALRGRPLAHAIARCLLARQGGQLEVSRSGGRTRVALALPAATI